MLKQIPLFILGILPIFSEAQNSNIVHFKIDAQVNFPDNDQTGRKIYFLYEEKERQKLDSTIITKNRFTFEGEANKNIRASLLFTKPDNSPEPLTDPNTLDFYLTAGTIYIKTLGNLNRAEITGSPLQVEYEAFKNRFKKIDFSIRAIGWRKRGLTDSLMLNTYNLKIDSLQQIKRQALSGFLDSNITKPYAPEALLMFINTKESNENLRKAKLYYENFSEEQKLSPDGAEIKKKITAL